MSLALLFHYLLLNMFRMLIHPTSGACDLFVESFIISLLTYLRLTYLLTCDLFFELFIISLLTAQHVSDVNTSILRSLRLVWWVIAWVVWFWFDMCWCYVVVVWYPYAGWNTTQCFSLHTDTTPPQRNTNTHRTRTIQPMQ